MDKVKDLRIDNDDLVFIAGDISVSESDEQHVLDIVFSDYGHWKQYPLIGVGINRYINSSGKLVELRRKIQEQLTGDGYRVNDTPIEFSGNELDINLKNIERVRNT